MTGLLTDKEIQALPEDIQPHYRQHGFLRDLSDLVYFPAAKRESLERLQARGAARTIELIRATEGDQAAEAAARTIAAERAERDRHAAELSRAS